MSNDTHSATSVETASTADRRQRFFVALLALAVVAALGLRTTPLGRDHSDFANPWDHHKYIWMAENEPAGFHIAPFCWRIGTPLLARALPGGSERSFYFISFASLWLTGVLLFLTARRLGFDAATALTGMLLFYTMGWMVKANLFNFWKPDPLAALAITAAIYCAVTNRTVWFAVLLALGTGVKESVLFAAPLYYTLHAKRPWDGGLLARTILLALPGAAVLVAIRLAVPAWNDDPAYVASLPYALAQVQLGTSAYDYTSAFREIGVERLRSFGTSSIHLYTIGTFGAIACMLPLFSLRRGMGLLLRFLPFLLLIYAQPLFATNAERLVVMGFPAVIPAGLFGIATLSNRLDVPARWFTLLPASLLVILVAKKGMIVAPFGYEALLFLLVLALVVSLRDRRPE